MVKTRKFSRRGRGKKNLTTKQREKKEVAKEYKKVTKQISSLEKKIPKNSEIMNKLVNKIEKSVKKLDFKKEQLENTGLIKLENKRLENLRLEKQIVELKDKAEILKSNLSYTGLALAS